MKNRQKNLLIVAVLVLLIGSIAYFGDFTTEEDTPSGNIAAGEMDSFIECLDDSNVKMYGAEWCPYCTELAESFGGYDVVDPIWVECTEEQQRCEEEMIDSGVPEIQIEGEKYEGQRNPEAIGEAAGC